MNLKNLFIFILLSVSNNALSMKIEIGKKYKNRDTGEIVTIKHNVPNVLKVNGFINVGEYISNKLITAYLKKCCIKSNKSHMLKNVSPELYEGREEVIKLYVDEKYYGTFYYAANKDNVGECFHESWLEPVEN